MTPTQIRTLCHYIETHTDEKLTLQSLSDVAHISPYHLQRSFKAMIGMTPRQYVDDCRIKLLKQHLRSGAKISNAIFDAGFGSANRVYERNDTQLGMSPKQYRCGGEGLHLSYATTQTRLGLLMIAATDRGLCFVQFGKSAPALIAQLQNEYPHATHCAMQKMSPAFATWMRNLNDYLNGICATLTIPLDEANLNGSAFQIKVWRYLQGIAYGSVKTYTQIAEGIGHPKAIRAAASACAANRVALLIPCHRVLRGDGGLGGYKWGLERKEALLALEQTNKKPI